ncbi:MAG: transcriptional repressor [Anaerolineales bacterium]|nr:transcriptional repressor [Anaerolineales bacterium]MCX7607595.1 transcriptional repressor [Anaerolineales bacterium]MDW8227404.1 Fur family transcriptional regulator [Anaerolineales bacterium]
MSCLARHSQTLRARGYRMTPQRLAILEALHHDGHLSPAQVYQRVRQTGVTEATVYRTLEFLRANGIVFATYGCDGHLTYELGGYDHHHLVCRICGTQVQVKQEMLQDALNRIEQQTGYRMTDGHLTLVGLCPSCQGNSQAQA